MTLVDHADRLRKERKRRLIAHAAAISDDLAAAADRVLGLVAAVKRHEIDEWELVESIHNEVFGLHSELNLTGLTAKLVEAQVASLEHERLRRASDAA